jgi:hypothetical protein
MKDIYASDFPHGSAAGFNGGCTTGPMCTFYGNDEWLTCKEAREARATDFNLQKLPVRQPIARNRGGQVASATAVASTPRPATPAQKPANPVPVATAPVPPVAVSRPVETATPTAGAAVSTDDGIPYEKHGTTTGYSRGCRDKEGCPGIERIGKSCAQASTEYQRDWARRRAERDAAAATEPSTSAVTDESSVKVAEFPPAFEQLLEADPEPPTGGEGALDGGEPSSALDAPVGSNSPEFEAALAEHLAQIALLKQEFEDARARDAQAIDDVVAAAIVAERARVAEIQTTDDHMIKPRSLVDLQQEIAKRDPDADADADAAILQFPTGGAVAPQPVGLTIEPTANAGVHIELDLPVNAGAQLTVQVQVAASSEPGLGNLAITVGSR